jgi:CO/xanthine dehydrogenase FAD-binding subunit
VTLAFAPRSLGEALEVRAAHDEATPVAGGTDLMVDVNFGRLRPAALLDLSRLPELDGWHRHNGSVFVGAGMTFARIARELGDFPPLVQAALTIGSPQIRNRATIGGNLATASPAGDSIPVLAAYDADVVLASAGGAVRRLPWHRFLTGPKRTALEPYELVAGVEWDVVDGPGCFAKVGPRNANVIAVAGACVQLDEERRGLRVALGSVGPTVLRAEAAEAFGAAIVPWDEPEAAIEPLALEEFGRLAASATRPIDDARGSAVYRRHVAAALSRRLLVRALEERSEARC